jgi:anaerobic magnesium-protoporphyrin IX monomethyl ester cyclase
VKCALVIPAWVPEEIFSSKTAAAQINYWQPLGTLYVASSLREAGHEVVFLNGAFLSGPEILGQLKNFRPDVVGLYSTAFGWRKALGTASDIKRADGEAFIVVGGPYPSAAKEKCLHDSDDIDAVVVGEGERTMVELASRHDGRRGFEGVNGLVWRRGDGTVKNPPRELIDDLDALPFPARDLLDDSKAYIPPPATYRKQPVAVMTTSRGCSRRCIFCFQLDEREKRRIRYRSVENVLEEIRLCHRQGYREIKFIDDTLAADYDRAMELAGGIQRLGLKITWFASACVNQVDLRLLKAFKAAGCWAVLFGAESGVQKNLNSLRKGITIDQTRKAVEAARKAGLTVHTPFIFGIPGETFEEGLQTIEFSRELSPDIASFHALTPFPGTELHDNVERYGRLSGDLSTYTYQGAAFVPYTMTREEIALLRHLAYRRFYSRPGYLFRRFLRIRTAQELRAAARGLQSLFWLWVGKDVFRRP